ncbi:MAG: hypothetical protein ACR5K2_03785 [Wolbachia sp.]
MSTLEYLKLEERKQVLTQNQKAGYAKDLLLYSLIIKYLINLLTILCIIILSVVYIKTSIMSSSTSEEKKNPVVTLKAQT